ncbi:MarR family transcriptional regulator [Natrinema salsiterrestre]|uniref:MarR family transcriptional regulator n=1 Tax=Natrinema salsiterrestre TaxID=2950540 RepID=A0A9Q4Q1P5_9EURY|nr:helix-turn-helix domain-containing protein [Natrinema salsiterrestre]MDF9747494.1 MarR family transcriptional regulator [Natrinema salsiterrestre]
MPIDIEKFDESSDVELSEPTNGEKVVQFLARNNDAAFTPAEIADGAGVKRNSVGTVLRRLEDRDLVRHKGDYWAIGDMDRVRDAYRNHQMMQKLDERCGEEDPENWKNHAAEEK